jgi:small-conductance mechanosensitive channel
MEMHLNFFVPLYQKTEEMLLGFIDIIPLLGVAFVTLLITWVLAALFSGFLRKSLKRSHIRPSLRELFGTLLKVGIWTLGLLISATIVFPSLTPAKMLAAAGLGSVAIGFAFKDIFENFIAGILIMLRKPMRLGDFIVCEGVSGKVEQITIRETYIRQTDDQLVIVPNSILFKNPVFIETDNKWRRFDIVVGVAYSEDIDASRDVITKALQATDLISQTRGVEVYAREFNSSSIDFTVRWWAKSTPLDMHITRDKVVTSIKAALDDAGIEIPFPYRTLTFKEPLKVETSSAPNDSE